MSFLLGSGTTGADLAVPGTYQIDLSPLVLGAFYSDPSFLGCLEVREGFSGLNGTKNWNDEILNPYQVPELTPGGIDDSTNQLLFSADDAVVLVDNAVLADTGIAGGISASERIQVIGTNPPDVNGNVTVTVIRGAQSGPAATAHGQGAVFRLISSAIPAASDLGPDQTRPPIPHYNYLQREDWNVILASEVEDSARQGYIAGVPSAFEREFTKRAKEKLVRWNNSVLYGIGTPGQGGRIGSVSGDNSTLWGIVEMLNGDYNSSATVYDAANAANILAAVNDVNEEIRVPGGLPDFVFLSPKASRRAAALYKDQIRLTQQETYRGFFVQRFTTDLGNDLRLVVDPYLSQNGGKSDALVIDSSRIGISPWEGSLMKYITAPTMRDAKLGRCVSKMSLEARNTGDDAGQAHKLIVNLAA